MDWKQCFAPRTALIQSSAVRDFLRLAGQPGFISFAGGLPSPDLLPVSQVAAATESVLSRHGAQVLQYGETQGLAELRAAIAHRFYSPAVHPDNIIITTGSQQALDLVGRVLIDAGSVVAVQNPTYLSALAAWRPLGARFEELRFDPSPNSNCPPIHLTYVIPNFHNPTGATLNLDQRKHLAVSAMRLSRPVLEDDPYRELRFTGEHLPSIFDLADGVSGPVISVGSFSKVLAPGLRLGWIVAGMPLIQELVSAKQALDLHTSSLSQYIALEMLRTGVLDQLLPRLLTNYKGKRDVLITALESGPLTGVEWIAPEGGMFLFLKLPRGLQGRDLAKRALNQKLLVVPGNDFHLGGSGKNTLRLNFTHPKVEEIREGVTRLCVAFSACSEFQPS